MPKKETHKLIDELESENLFEHLGKTSVEKNVFFRALPE